MIEFFFFCFINKKVQNNKRFSKKKKKKSIRKVGFHPIFSFPSLSSLSYQNCDISHEVQLSYYALGELTPVFVFAHVIE